VLVHCVDELIVLGSRCILETGPAVNGWSTDIWRMTEADVSVAIDAYAALLSTGIEQDDEVAALLNDAGIDFKSLLIGVGEGTEKITRGDLCELVLAATLIGEGSDPDRMVMPNVPKMSRRKSDSGIDIFEAASDATTSGTALQAHERLGLTSVKHSIKADTSDLRYKLIASLSETELNPGYVMSQLRWLAGHMEASGWTKAQSRRLFLFSRDFPHKDHVSLMAGAVVDSAAESHMLNQLKQLPENADRSAHFRVVTFPGLTTAHTRCG